MCFSNRVHFVSQYVRVSVSIRSTPNEDESHAAVDEDMPDSVLTFVDSAGVISRSVSGDFVLTAMEPSATIQYRCKQISSAYNKRRFIVRFDPIPSGTFDPALAHMGGVDAPPLLVKTKVGRRGWGRI